MYSMLAVTELLLMTLWSLMKKYFHICLWSVALKFLLKPYFFCSLVLILGRKPTGAFIVAVFHVFILI